MAKQRAYMSIEDAGKLTYKELHALTRHAVRMARQRAQRLTAKGEFTSSPALKAAKETKPKGQKTLFEIGGKDRNKLLAEYKRAKAFMESETSTKQGARKWYENIRKRLSEESGIDIPNDRAKIDKLLNVLDKYDKAKDKSGDRNYRYVIIEKAVNIMLERPRLGGKGIFDIIEGKGEMIYNEYQEKLLRQREIQNVPLPGNR